MSRIIGPSSSFARPADTTQYAVGDLIANNTAAASVVPLIFDPTRGNYPSSAFGDCYVAGIRIHKTSNSITSASFRVHLFDILPTFTSSGDNGVFATVVATGNLNWKESFDVTMVAHCADGASGIAIPTEGVIIPQIFNAQAVIYGLIEALGTYTPSSAESFTARLLMEID